jgi:hypothetical protein
MAEGVCQERGRRNIGSFLSSFVDKKRGRIYEENGHTIEVLSPSL